MAARFLFIYLLLFLFQILTNALTKAIIVHHLQTAQIRSVRTVVNALLVSLAMERCVTVSFVFASLLRPFFCVSYDEQQSGLSHFSTQSICLEKVLSITFLIQYPQCKQLILLVVVLTTFLILLLQIQLFLDAFKFSFQL